jgi:DNA-binding XRE family transcriptional regulator
VTETRPWPRDPRFLVSDDGTVRGPSGWVIAVVPSKEGYRLVSHRTAEGKRTSTAVHVMVCETFHGPRPSGAEAAHENGDPSDCRAVNVRWDTKRGNMADRVRHGTNSKRLTAEVVTAIRAEPSTSRAELANRFGVTPGTISHIRKGHTWQHLPSPTHVAACQCERCSAAG